MLTPKQDFQAKLFKVFSDIKAFKMPLFISYRPQTFALKGHHTREIMKLVKPGDILVRSFKNYLNGHFVPGTFQQAGFYLSEVTEEHLRKLAQVEHPTEFRTGRQIVIHAINGKVVLEDLIDFCRCDGLAVMRFPRQLKSSQPNQIPDILQLYFEDPTPPIELEEEKPKKKTKKKGKEEEEPEEETSPPASVPPDATTLALVKAEKDIAQHLAQGKVVEFEKIVKILYRIALKELSSSSQYDFGIDPFPATSSTELVYFITKSFCWTYGIDPELSKVFFKKRPVILPDAFVDNDLEEIWKMVG
jgi:hypothetical protein